MKEINYRCDACKAIVNQKDAMVIILTPGKEIRIHRFTTRSADNFPCICGMNCLHNYLSSHFGEFYEEKDNDNGGNNP